MFIYPGTGLPYTPTPSYFLGCFDIYDREETLGSELEQFDPNEPADREKLIVEYALKGRRSYREKYLLYKCLEVALLDREYNFQVLLEHDSQECSSLPDGWDEMENPRLFFEEIYRLAGEVWKEDLYRAGAEDQSTWHYI
ncbi:hypothetical protein [Pseudomonas sp. D1-2]|uniref:hypothetical protein n=1 Tax=unclassified Pseudomonas TaxID=196821 RepID=UPI003DA7CB43